MIPFLSPSADSRRTWTELIAQESMGAREQSPCLESDKMMTKKMIHCVAEVEREKKMKTSDFAVAVTVIVVAVVVAYE